MAARCGSRRPSWRGPGRPTLDAAGAPVLASRAVTEIRTVVLAALLVAAYALLVAASRVYLGVHWFSDVTAGLIVGTFFLLGVETVLVRQHARYPCGQVSGTSSPAVTGRWSDSLENSPNPSLPGLGTEALVTSVPSDT